MRYLAVLLLAWAAPVLGQVPVPAQLKTLLVRARGHLREHLETRGATSDYAQIKDQLREWIESRLNAANPERRGDCHGVSAQCRAC
jgi:hypothetical protein